MANGDPRVQYNRRYNVIPDDATEREAAAIFLEGWRRSRETSGGSYDDAGIGNLTHKIACLYNIDPLHRDQYIAFYRDHYPKTTVIFADVDPELLNDEPLPPVPEGFAIHATTILEPFPFTPPEESP